MNISDDRELKESFIYDLPLEGTLKKEKELPPISTMLLISSNAVKHLSFCNITIPC